MKAVSYNQINEGRGKALCPGAPQGPRLVKDMSLPLRKPTSSDWLIKAIKNSDLLALIQDCFEELSWLKSSHGIF